MKRRDVLYINPYWNYVSNFRRTKKKKKRKEFKIFLSSKYNLTCNHSFLKIRIIFGLMEIVASCNIKSSLSLRIKFQNNSKIKKAHHISFNITPICNNWIKIIIQQSTNYAYFNLKEKTDPSRIFPITSAWHTSYIQSNLEEDTPLLTN